MAEVRWSDEALNQLDLIQAYVAQFDPAAGRRLGERLIEAALSLRDFPERGRPAPNGRRSLLTVRPYVVLYELADTVLVLGIRHGAQIADTD